MKKLRVVYADGTKETIPSELTPEEFFDSRFGGLPEEIREKCKVTQVVPKEATASEKK